MRVAFALYGDLSIRTGGFLYDRMLVQGFERRGVEVDLIQLPWSSYPNALVASLLRRGQTQFPNGQYDLLIQDELSHPSFFITNSYIRKTFKIPIVSIVHHLRSSEQHSAPLLTLYRQVERIYLNSLDGIIANSSATLAEVKTLLDRRLPAIVAPPGRDHLNSQISKSEIKARASAQGPLEVLFLGSVIPRKRLADLVAALGRLPDHDVRLTIIGRDAADLNYVRQVRQALKSNLPDDRVRWLGEQPDAQVAEALGKSHLLAVPSSHEGFGIAYLDAMAFGVVPIGTRCGGASSIIDHRQNGFLVEPGDIDALREHIASLASDRETLKRMALRAFERYQLHPTWEEVTESVYDYIETTFIGQEAQLILN